MDDVRKAKILLLSAIIIDFISQHPILSEDPDSLFALKLLGRTADNFPNAPGPEDLNAELDKMLAN